MVTPLVHGLASAPSRSVTMSLPEPARQEQADEGGGGARRQVKDGKPLGHEPVLRLRAQVVAQRERPCQVGHDNVLWTRPDPMLHP